jgi:Xaa-Pro dipeptidase
MTNLYRQHVARLREQTEKALAECNFDALLIHSGTPFTYFADDQDAPFHTTPHFAHWVPLEGPHHLLLIRAGEKPLLVRVKPDDYWYEQLPLGNPFWLSEFEWREVGSKEDAWREITDFVAHKRIAFIGDAVDAAEAKGVLPEAINTKPLVARLNWNRSYKTPYEVACLEEAQRVAALGHIAAREAFYAGKSELEIHQHYVHSVGCIDEDLPYPSIVALDQKGATLHYQRKRNVGGSTLLLDSGAKHLGYCSDITRTWTRPECDSVFKELVVGVDRVQQELCALVVPGLSYPELHQTAHIKIGDLLHALGIIAIPGDEAAQLGLTSAFFPHGLGHFLGIQVHDVSGNESYEGEALPSSTAYPRLRMTRVIETDQVFTIEPGVYFIETLLTPYREGTHAEKFNWELINRLSPFGGVRIEDDILVTTDGHRNLTRFYI